MKKIFLLFLALIITPQAFAYIEEYTTSDIKTMQGTGTTLETMKIIDTVKTLKQGVNKDYVPFFGREITPENKYKRWYKIAKVYFDPLQDENVFGVREIWFENAWFPLSPSYSLRTTPNDKYQRFYPKDINRFDTAGKIIKGSHGIEENQKEYPSYGEVGRAIDNL